MWEQSYFSSDYQSAYCNCIEPIFDKTFIYDSYACRKGKGQHKAVQRFTQFCQKNKYVLKCDIRKYFPTIDHEILKEKVRQKIADKKTLWLIDLIIDSSNEQERVEQYFWGDDFFSQLKRKGIPIADASARINAAGSEEGVGHASHAIAKCKFLIANLKFSFCNLQLFNWAFIPTHQCGGFLACSL